MNIFQKIGDYIETKKKLRKSFENKYWKLSSTERIEYDLKKEEIESTLPLLSLFIAKISFSILILLIFTSILFPKDISTIQILFKRLLHLSFVMFFIFLIGDILIFFESLIFFPKLKQIQKRFGLISKREKTGETER